MQYSPHFAGEPADLCQWWTQFQDPVLDAIVADLICQNFTLREAGERINEARARLAIARGEQWPQSQQMVGAYSRNRISSNTANFFEAPGVFTPDLNFDNWSVGFQANWELDFWGRYYRAIEASSADLGAAVAQYDQARVLLIAEAAREYLRMRGFEQRIAIAKANAEIQHKTLQLVQRKKENGVATGVDEAQAESKYEATRALIPPLETQRLLATHRLCELMGRPPCDLTKLTCYQGTCAIPPAVLAVGIPADLLRQRPDVRLAERQLAAQSARIGIAEAEFYPHIGLNSSIGYSSEDLSSLFQPNSAVGVLSPNFSWNILNYCRIRNNVVAEKAKWAGLAHRYQSTVLTALREAEDAQVTFLNAHRQTEALQTAVKATELAVERAEKAYQGGASDYSRVYLLQTDLAEQQDLLSIAETGIALSLIDLYKSLGGGWQACGGCAPVGGVQAPCGICDRAAASPSGQQQVEQRPSPDKRSPGKPSPSQPSHLFAAPGPDLKRSAPSNSIGYAPIDKGVETAQQPSLFAAPAW